MKRSVNFKSTLQLSKGNPLAIQDRIQTDLILIYKNREKTFIGEILIYDGAGLIAQMGGILSLFLGFSFLSIIYGIFDFMEKKLMLSDFKVISLSAGHQETRLLEDEVLWVWWTPSCEQVYRETGIVQECLQGVQKTGE